MIIKSHSHRRKRFRDLISYIMSDNGRYEMDKTFQILHNLRSTDKESIIKEFTENFQFKNKRKNSVVLYHEILSFSPNDRSKIDLNILEDISRKFIELRGDNALCYAQPHLSENLHIHFCFSSNGYRSAKSIRLSKSQFKQIRLDMEQYQRERYPELSNSIVYLDKWQKNVALEKEKVSEKEFQVKKRTGRSSEKEQVRKLVHDCFTQSSSRDDFFKRLITEGLELYKYRDKVNGLLWQKRRYRFKSLNISQEQLKSLQKGAKRMDELTAIMKRKKDKTRNLER